MGRKGFLEGFSQEGDFQRDGRNAVRRGEMIKRWRDRQMDNRIREINALRITIGRRKLARDKKSIQIIFQVLEECGIPCECMAINIDWLAVVVRAAMREKVEGFVAELEGRLSHVNISMGEEIVLFYLENWHMTSRGIGFIVTSLSLQDVDIILQRYVRCEDRLVIGVDAEEAREAGEILKGVLESYYQL